MNKFRIFKSFLSNKELYYLRCFANRLSNENEVAVFSNFYEDDVDEPTGILISSDNIPYLRLFGRIGDGHSWTKLKEYPDCFKIRSNPYKFEENETFYSLTTELQKISGEIHSFDEYFRFEGSICVGRCSQDNYYLFASTFWTSIDKFFDEVFAKFDFSSEKNKRIFADAMAVIEKMARLIRRDVLSFYTKTLGFKFGEYPVSETMAFSYDAQNNILRRDIVSARDGERFAIPYDNKILICRGKGNKDWMMSCPASINGVLTGFDDYPNNHTQGTIKARQEAFTGVIQGDGGSCVGLKNFEHHISPTAEVIDVVEVIRQVDF